MEKILVEGGFPLRGSVDVRGAKNAALPILFSTLLSDEPCRIRNIPNLRDVDSTLAILEELGIHSERDEDGTLEVYREDPTPFTAPYEHVRRMRASVCALGPLLAKRGKAKVSLPGGCVFGVRPIDLHLKGLRALGAQIRIQHGYIEAETNGRLRGATIYLGGPFGSSVLGTANVLMAATLAKGTTVIEAAACEPEIEDLAACLIKMGAKIKGVGTPKLEIEGVEDLGGFDHEVIPDRIEAATLLIAGAITRGDVIVRGARMDHLSAVVDTLHRAGMYISSEDNAVRLYTNGTFRPIDVTTLPYPGFPTDVQAQMMALLAVADGMSVITEKIYPDRFIHISELGRMGANIRKEGSSAIVNGVRSLSGCPVMASDLRASASLVLAGLVADGVTEIHRVYHLDRGYERIEERLKQLGAKIWRETAVEEELLV
ncbi:MAG: UDP-N-acetylglucosamine 1-carboxyvinyltransferase [Planctomycetota bacterium]